MTVDPELNDGDVIRVRYTARVSDSGRVIDTTDAEIAYEADMADIEANGPRAVVLGEGHLFEPVEQAIKEGTLGESMRVTVDPDEAFGQVDPADYTDIDIDLIPEDKREPGSRLRHKGQTAFVESLNDEYAKLNFNHPLAGQAIEYELTVQERIKDPLERVRAVLDLYGLGEAIDASFEASDPGELQITVPDPANGAWSTEKERALDALQDLSSVESITVIEMYGEPP